MLIFLDSNLNYSRDSIRTDSCTMNLKIDPYNYNTLSIDPSKGYKIPVTEFRAVVKLSRFVIRCYSSCTHSLPIFESVS